MTKVIDVPSCILLLLLSGATCCLSSSASGAVKDACTIVASSDVEAVLGEPVGPPKPEDHSGGAGPGSKCTFSSAQGKVLARKSVSVSVQYTNDELDNATGGIAQNLKSAGFKNVHEISGVGDHAVWGTTSMMGKLMSELTVLKGKHTMVIVLITGLQEEATALERAKVLASKVVPKT